MVAHLRTDEEIQRNIQEELQWNMRLYPNDIGVVVKDGIVTLIGEVDTYAKKLVARQAAHRVPGVRAVNDILTVRLPAFDEHTDADLAAAILDALAWDQRIPMNRLHVTVSQGWVTLTGEVEDGHQKNEVEDIVARLSGVKGITNAITVKPQVGVTDLKQHIDQALLRNAETDARNISVKIEGNKVILSGTVCSPAERKAAAEAARSAPGITEVVNRIVVSYP
jgi:osmotically-inducible protein OsmY